MRFSRSLLCCLLGLCLAASPAFAQVDANGGPEGGDIEGGAEGGDSSLVVLNGRGFGHAVGLSQYGAYGRALAGDTYDKILSFYYDGTTLAPITDFKEFDPDRVPETVDVDVGVRELIAISTPLEELGPGEWELSVEVGGTVVGVSTLPLTTHYDGARWHAEYTDKTTGTTTDVCDGQALCENTVLEVAQTIGTRAVIEEYEDGPNLGSHLGGRYLLRPAGVAVDGATPDVCGTGLEFCITHSRLRRVQPGTPNVLIGVREEIAISTPLDELGPGKWELSVEAGGQLIGLSTLPLTTRYDGARWHAEYTDESAGVTTDLCDNDSRCLNTALEVVQTVGTRAVVEEFEDGPNLGSYAGARYLLHPAGVPLNGSTPDRCGTGLEFCVVVADLDMEKYLYGLQEVPTDWPAEALKAQAVAARSYAAATIVNRAAAGDWADEPFNLYDSTADQVFTGWARESGCVWHSWCDAVNETAAEVVVYQAEIATNEDPTTQNPDTTNPTTQNPDTTNPTTQNPDTTNPTTESPDTEGSAEDGSSQRTDDETGDVTGSGTQNGEATVVNEPRIAQAFYSSSNGGHTAKPSDVWSGGVDLPFLVPKPDPFDAAVDPETGRARNPNATWTRSYSIAELTRWLNNYTVGGEAPLNITSLRGIDIANAPKSGHVLFAEVTVHDAGRSVTLRRNGEPYGAWLFYAIWRGCKTAQGCRPPVGSQFTIEWPTNPAPEAVPVFEFSDLSPDDYFYEPVLWAANEEVVSGAAPQRLGPHDQINRAEFAEILWRFEGRKRPHKRNNFEDIAADASYHDAVHLLTEYRVTTGTSPTTFSPEMTLTRAQASTFLWRFAGTPEPNVDSTFEDVPAGSYYSDAVRWMVEHGITTGTSPTTFSPDNPTTRAEAVTFIWRLAGLPDAFAAWVRPMLPPKMRTMPNS